VNSKSPFRHGLPFILVITACLTAICVIALTPLALTGLQGLSKEWAKLSNVGQAYGAVSALISSLALVGVVVSLLFQARAGRTAREQSIRTLQQQLIRMEMEDPALMSAVGAPWGLPIPPESAKIREHLYIHMWTSFWAGNYVVGEMTDPAVRKMARGELLNSIAGRTYWANIRDNVLSTNEGKYRHFALIVDEEYRKVMADNIPVAPPIEVTGHSAHSSVQRETGREPLIIVVAALMTGVLAGQKLAQRAHRAR
jgi:Family of unknown function (DUF6082)